jgi:hypothetical protein
LKKWQRSIFWRCRIVLFLRKNSTIMRTYVVIYLHAAAAGHHLITTRTGITAAASTVRAASTTRAAVAAAYQVANSLVGAASHSLAESVDTTETASNDVSGCVCDARRQVTCDTNRGADRAVELGEKSESAGTSIAAISARVAILACGHLLLLYFDKKKYAIR